MLSERRTLGASQDNVNELHQSALLINLHDDIRIFRNIWSLASSNLYATFPGNFARLRLGSFGRWSFC